MASQAAHVNINVPSQDDIAKMLACNVHLGSKSVDPNMQRYVYKRNTNGIHIINLQKTFEKIVLAARMIVALEEMSDVCIVASRPYGQRAALKFATLTGAKAVAGRFTPGTFTNQDQPKFSEPRLIIVTDPHTDGQALVEASYANIPAIAICNTDSPTRHVDCVIPANNKAKHSIGLIYWLLCREVLRLQGKPARSQPWDVMVDLFFYRDPDEAEKEEATPDAHALTYDYAASTNPEWSGAPPEWDGSVQAPAGTAEWAEQNGTAAWDQSVSLGGQSWDSQPN
ncbi:MAG: 30S ribosomal protein S2 [archaeon]|nr:30S ribosomal protein S2 [archaeon]